LTELQTKLLASAITVIVLLVARRLVLRAVQPRVEELEAMYRARKISTYVITVVGLVTLGFIWLDAFDNLPTYLGLVSAGVAIALSDLLKNIAGWLYIVIRRPFRVGDRVEIAGLKGDVVDIRLFRFSLLEVGGWVDAEQSTFRLLHIPNGRVFTEAVANYTEGFDFVWHEIPVLVTFESNWRRAEEIVKEALATRAPEIEEQAARHIRETARRYHIKVGTLSPTVYLTVRDSGVVLTARFLTHTRHRRSAEETIWKSLLTLIEQDPAVELAYPTVRTYLHGPITLGGDRPAPLRATGDPTAGPSP
jgi:small-conductance mechanosensitive channel